MMSVAPANVKPFKWKKRSWSCALTVMRSTVRPALVWDKIGLLAFLAKNPTRASTPWSLDVESLLVVHPLTASCRLDEDESWPFCLLPNDMLNEGGE